MASILPLTPGLLISMALRYDHSFGMPPFSIDQLDAMGKLEEEEDHSKLVEKQIGRLRVVALVYHDFVKKGRSLQIDTVSASQLLEEAYGVGFFKPDREDRYTAIATREALLEAEQLCLPVSRSPIIPIVTIIGE